MRLETREDGFWSYIVRVCALIVNYYKYAVRIAEK
jgi:hypothetical protein